MALARTSIPTWNGATHPGDSKVCTSFRFVDGGDSTSTTLGFDQTSGAHNENLVVFRSGLCSDQTDALCTSPPVDPTTHLPDLGACVAKTNCWEHDSTTGNGSVIALTSVVYHPDTGEIVDADMELHDLSSSPTASGFYFTCPGPPALPCSAVGQSGCVDTDIGNTVTHEAGHMLGLDHCVPNGTGPSACPVTQGLFPVMAPTATTGDTDKRILKPDDIDAVCSIYPVASSGSGSSGGGGCGYGTATAGGLAVLGLFLAALWPRRRSGARKA
jgi:hypothetical protein